LQSQIRTIRCINCPRYGHPKIFVLVGRDASNAQETIQPIIRAGRNPGKLNAFCARATIQPITKAV